MIRKAFIAVAALFIFSANSAIAQDNAIVELFSPEGTVKGVRQVTAKFSAQMVAFGDPRLADPFDIRCPEKGKGRWIDGKNWSFDFDRDLPAGIICEFSLKKGIRSLAGRDITGKTTFSFSTGGPAIRGSSPHEGNESIDEKQIFVLVLDAAPKEESILKHVYFSVEGIKERVGVEIIKGEQRQAILDAIIPKGKDSFKVWARKIAYRLIYKKVEDSYIVLLQAKQIFPPSSEVKLIWGEGVMSASGVATAQDQALAYKTRIPFKAEFSCARENPKAGCIPILPVNLYFSAPVPIDAAKQIVLRDKKGKVWKPKFTTEEGDDKKSVRNVVFEGPFPEKTTFRIEVPRNIKDDAGRPLSNLDKFPLEVSTHTYPPLAKFSSRFGIIERKGDGLLPVTVRNIEADIRTRLLKVVDDSSEPDATAGTGYSSADKAGVPAQSSKIKIDQSVKGKVRHIPLAREDMVIKWLHNVAAATRESSVFKVKEAKSIAIPKPGGGRPFEVMGIPLSGPGFYVVELESEILGEHLLKVPAEKEQGKGTSASRKRPAIKEQAPDKTAPMYVQTSALVTNLAAHFKWGRESSLVWVTTLDKGTPVNGAAVSIRDCEGTRIWQGKTDDRGVAMIKTALPSEETLPRCSDEINYSEASRALTYLNTGLYVFARTTDDMTFTHSSWNEGIEPWRFQLPEAYGSSRDGIIAHSILDRKLFRAGETVHMKHVMRVHTTAGFAQVPSERRPNEITIQHQGSDQQYRFPVVWLDNGIAESVWKIPENAKLGSYNIILSNKKEDEGNLKNGKKSKAATKRYLRHSSDSWTSGSFQVEEFRVPLMKGIIHGPAFPLIRPKEVIADLSVSYLAGGGASDMPVRVRAEIQEKHVSFPDFEDYTFAGEPLKEGVVSSAAQFGMEETEEGETGEPSASGKSPRLPTQDLHLDSAGAARVTFSKLPDVVTARDIHAELEFKDPNGEVKTAATNIALYPAGRVVGIRPDSWAASKDKLIYRIAVVDLKGKPIESAVVTVDLYQEKTMSHRVRLVGGFYSYRHTTSIKKIGRHFSGKTGARGILLCEGKSPVSGSVILHTEVEDEAGNKAYANYTVWVAGKDEWWFEARNDDRIDVLPEKKRYEPGETARFQVRMPFRTATALVTVEREGIVDTYIKKLSGKMPVLEIPVKNNYTPNVFVSALVVRGRVGGTKPTATFDPGRPAYRIGIGEINVGWKDHELKVEVTPNKKIFSIREEMDVRIKVRKADGELPPKKSEVAVAAVDEGLLQLMPNDTWKLLNAMMQRRAYELKTSTAQAMVVGKRHFGLKARPHGGGGGKQITRELFDTLLIWKGRVILDDNGEAAIKIPLNDSLTGFRIVAVAMGGAGHFGTGETSVRTTQDLMLLSGIPQLVREGDKFRAGFTVRNTSDRNMDVELQMTITGKDKSRQAPILESIPAGAAKEVAWSVTVPYDVDKLVYEAEAKEKSRDTYDRVKITQNVAKAVPTRTFQATLMQVRDKISVDVEKPADAVSGRGGVYVRVKPSLADSLAGVTEYMSRYPYICLEQKISQAVALRDEHMWKSLMGALPSYLDSDGLLKYFPPMLYGSDVLTSYVLSVADEAGYEIPAYLSNKIRSGLKGFISGRVIRYGALPTADLSIRKISAVEALSRYESVNENMLSSLAIEPNLWPTYAVINWISILNRVEGLKNQEARLQAAQQILRSRLNLQGTTMNFSTETISSLWWLMESLDSNFVKAVLVLTELDSWNEDVPRLTAGALGRMRRGHWDTTVSNAWGILAMEKFSEKFEKVPVTGATTARMKRTTKTIDWKKTPDGGDITFAWPRAKETLSISQEGTGAPWAIIRSMAAIPLKQPFSSGYKIKKTFIPVEQKVKGKWSRGDIVRIRLDMESQADMTWVVVSDPIPAGSSILRQDLGGTSILTAGEKKKGWAWVAFTERSFEAYRTYYEYVPKGEWTVEYTIRLNNEGTFQLPATRVEALYAPEMFGEIPNRDVQVD
jgi:alpha-2-macroglobulin